MVPSWVKTGLKNMTTLNKVKKIKFIGLGVVIHPEVSHKILRPMVMQT